MESITSTQLRYELKMDGSARPALCAFASTVRPWKRTSTFGSSISTLRNTRRTPWVSVLATYICRTCLVRTCHQQSPVQALAHPAQEVLVVHVLRAQCSVDDEPMVGRVELRYVQHQNLGLIVLHRAHVPSLRLHLAAQTACCR